MADDKKIADYVRALTRALSALPERDRADIVGEIRSHLDYRAAEGKLADAIKALGSPERCARGFIEEMRIQSAFADGGPAKTFGALLALASARITAAVGLFFSGILYLMAIAFVFVGFSEMVAPESVGLWSDPVSGSFFFGTMDLPAPPTAKELLGRWMIPVAGALAVLAFVAAQWLTRLFLRLMMAKRPAQPI